MELIVWDENLKPLQIFDQFKSLIWSNKYNGIGDCEVYVPATAENIDVLKIGHYLARKDDPMVCIIETVEIQTNAEDGDYMIVTGYDVKKYLDERIVWGTAINRGSAEVFARKLVTESCISPENDARRLRKPNGEPLIVLGQLQEFPDSTNEQVSYMSVGEKVREICDAYKWGYRLPYDYTQNVFLFEIYKGLDRSNSVIFSPDLETIAGSDYTRDISDMGNALLVGGAGEGSDRTVVAYGSAVGTSRKEKFINASQIAENINFFSLRSTYPSGSIVSVSGKFFYFVDRVDFIVTTFAQLEALAELYPSGTVLQIGESTYYRIRNVYAAELPSGEPEDSTSCTLEEAIYIPYLLQKGVEELANNSERFTFDATIAPGHTYIYKEDYFLGDTVRIKNGYGIAADARIVEALESEDESGYNFELTLEYEKIYLPEEEPEAIITESLSLLRTESGETLATE